MFLSVCSGPSIKYSKSIDLSSCHKGNSIGASGWHRILANYKHREIIVVCLSCAKPPKMLYLRTTSNCASLGMITCKMRYSPKTDVWIQLLEETPQETCYGRRSPLRWPPQMTPESRTNSKLSALVSNSRKGLVAHPQIVPHTQNDGRGSSAEWEMQHISTKDNNLHV